MALLLGHPPNHISTSSRTLYTWKMGLDNLQSLNAKIILVSVIGLGLSVYAFIVENKLEVDENYEPMCDISEHAKCSLAFSSEYGKGFGLVSSSSIFYKPNSIYGIIYYCVTITLGMMNKPLAAKLLVFLALLSNITSVYFAYILYFILYDFCIVCVSIYIVNAVILYLAYLKNNVISKEKTKTE